MSGYETYDGRSTMMICTPTISDGDGLLSNQHYSANYSYQETVGLKVSINFKII